jgi:hypothetical protein
MFDQGNMSHLLNLQTDELLTNNSMFVNYDSFEKMMCITNESSQRTYYLLWIDLLLILSLSAIIENYLGVTIIE